MPRVRPAVLVAHDELLRDVDESAGQVAGVGGPQRRVGEALARAVGGDEVLEDGQALAEVRLDRARDDLAARVRDQAAHAGDLAHLDGVPSGTGADHHLDRVEPVGGETRLHGLGDLVGRVGPQLTLELAALVVGQEPAIEVLLDLVGLTLEPLEELRLLRRRLDVGDRDRQPGAGRELEAEVLEVVEALGDLRLRVAVDHVADDLGERALLQALACRCRGTGSREGTPR